MDSPSKKLLYSPVPRLYKVGVFSWTPERTDSYSAVYLTKAQARNLLDALEEIVDEAD